MFGLTENSTVETNATGLLRMLGECHDAKAYAQALALIDAYPYDLPPLARHFQSAALQGTRQYDNAVMPALLAATLAPNLATRSNLALALWRTGQTQEAHKLWRQLLRGSPKTPDEAIALGHLRLSIERKSGQWRKALCELESRIGTDRAPDYGLPVWDGAKSSRVIVLHEQGIGDAVLLGRYLPWVAKQSGHHVTWAGPRVLHRWVSSIEGVGECVEPSEALAVIAPARPTVASQALECPETRENTHTSDSRGDSIATVAMLKGDCIVRAFSLPHLHGTTPDNIPLPTGGPTRTRGAGGGVVQRGVPTPLQPEPILEGCQDIGHLRVGVCWAGDRSGHADFERSTDKETFLRWVPEGVEVVNLQYGSEGGPSGDVWEVAERIAGCDLVVSVDTSIVHMAGSMGVPTVVVPPSAPDWRYPTWAKDGECPWYPDVVVVRRDRADEWEGQLRSAWELVRMLRQQ